MKMCNLMLALAILFATSVSASAATADWGDEFNALPVTNGAGLYLNNSSGASVSAYRSSGLATQPDSTWGASPAGNNRGDGIYAKSPAASVSGGIYTLAAGTTSTGMVAHYGPASATDEGGPFGLIAGPGAVGKFTFETRAKIDNLVGSGLAGWPLYWQNRGNNGLRFNLAVGKNNAAVPYFILGDTGNTELISNTFAGSNLVNKDPLAWHTYRVTYDGGTAGGLLSLFIDGQLQGSATLGAQGTNHGNRGFSFRQDSADSAQQVRIDYMRVVRGASVPIDEAVNAVPEPSTLTLLGLAGLGLIRRRR